MTRGYGEKVETHEIASACGTYKRQVWLAENPSTRWLCVFLDAELYLNRVEALEVAREFGTCLFVSNLNMEARHYDYTCNPDYAEFIVEDVLCRFGGKEKTLLAGLSLSGLAAAHLALTYPSRFDAILCQSGSFWWNDEWLTTQARKGGRFWLSVGDQETDCGISHPPTGLRQEVSQMESVKRAAEALGAHLSIFEGGHDPARWKRELPEALAWLTSGEAS